MSSFLGIGGGPINLVVLFYFFSMETKTAAQNSLYIILFSQITSLLTTLITHSVPEFTLPALVLMIAGGIGGRPHAEQAEEQPCRGQAVPGIDGHYYFDQHLQCSALYGRLRFVGRQEGGVISIRN